MIKMLLKVTNGSISFGSTSIIEEINFELKEKEKVAIVGRNGCGKSSFLKALIDEEQFDVGIGEEPFKIEKNKNMSIGYLEQMALKNEENTLLEEFNLVFEELREMEKKLKSLENTEYLKYEALKQEYTLKGGYEYRGSIDKILIKFGFSLEDKKKKIREFSGGQRTKIALMKLLLSKPDILFLDEPTNHLDIETILWLEDYLKNYPKAILLVSHDRMFLDNIVNKVYEIEYGAMKKYIGNYTAFERQKKENYEKNLKDYEWQQKEIKRLQSIADRFRYKPSKASMAMSKLKKIEQMVKIAKPEKEDTRNIKLKFPVLKESGDVVLTLKKLSFGYDTILNTVSFVLHKKERLAILGANGTGKSTLLKTIMGKVDSLSGSIEFGYHVSVAYFDQQMEFESEKRSVLEELKTILKEKTEEQIRAYLGAFLFTEEDVFKPIEVLSGGEKVRLELAKIIAQGPNLLILDEPTNHVDLQGREALETCLKNYEGTILLVSHDRYFVSEIADSLLILEGSPLYYRGTYQEYQKEQKETLKKEEKKTNKRKSEPKKNDKERKKEIRNLELEIKKLEEKLKEIESNMLKEENYLDYEKMQELERLRTETKRKLEEKMNLWITLMETTKS